MLSSEACIEDFDQSVCGERRFEECKPGHTRTDLNPVNISIRESRIETRSVRILTFFFLLIGLFPTIPTSDWLIVT